MDRIAALEVFVNVVEHKGFSTAAWYMNLMPGTVSKAIKSLEAELGFQLFHRTTKKIVLTEQGQMYYPLAKEIVEKFKASKNIKELTHEISGVITIALPSYVANFFLVDPINAFLKQYPKIKIRFLHYNPLALLEEGEADIAFSNYKLSDPKIHYDLIFSKERLLIASPQYIKEQGTPQSIFELTERDCLVSSILQPEGIWEFGKHKIKVNARVYTHQTVYLIEAAVKGMGILWVPDLLVKEQLENGELQPLDFDYEKALYLLYLCYPSRPKGDKVRLLVDFLRETFGIK